MKGIENIIARIESDSAAEAAAIAEAAAARCAEIAADADKRAREEYGRLFTAGVKEAETRVTRLGSVANLEARKQVLATKQEMVSAAFDRAMETITEMPDEQYASFLGLLAYRAAVTGSEELIFSPADRDRVGYAVCSNANAALRADGRAAALTVSDKTRNITGGVIIADGSIEYNCTVDALVNAKRDELASQVASMLFNL